MSEFEEYQPITVSMVQRISVTLDSLLVDELDQNGAPTGQMVEEKSITITAHVTDDTGFVLATHTARNNRVVELGLITQNQADQLRGLLDGLRVIADGRLLPV